MQRVTSTCTLSPATRQRWKVTTTYMIWLFYRRQMQRSRSHVQGSLSAIRIRATVARSSETLWSARQKSNRGGGESSMHLDAQRLELVLEHVKRQRCGFLLSRRPASPAKLSCSSTAAPGGSTKPFMNSNFVQPFSVVSTNDSAYCGEFFHKSLRSTLPSDLGHSLNFLD